MHKRKAIVFMFNIAKEIEKSFLCPIIYFTETDYADSILKSLNEMSNALQQSNLESKTLLEIVNIFHYNWLNAVQEITTFKTTLKDVPQDVLLKTIDFTIKCVDSRDTFLRNYITDMQYCMTDEEKQMMDANINIIAEIKEIGISALLEKEKIFQSQEDQDEYLNLIGDELESLLNWLDRINDNVALHFSKVLDLNVLISNLTNTLQTIIKEVLDNPDNDVQAIAKLINFKTETTNQTVEPNTNEIEISIILKKIRDLKDRILTLRNEKSFALEHKKKYLEERLDSLENIKQSWFRLPNQNPNEHIFNHMLPHSNRCRLVKQLIKLWNTAIEEQYHKSIISILSGTDLKETFSDIQGKFCVDKYGRKIYLKENDPKLYQLNENNELVVVNDDVKHAYFYDECGRYYINSKNQRIYKAHTNASEYILNKYGLLVKVSDIENGIEYFYNKLGKYHIDNNGKKIYTYENDSEEYEDDGLGNITKINHKEYFYETCTNKLLSLAENLYLQEVVGPALKKCLASVILLQPSDPIAYLAKSLIKYRENVDIQQRRLDEVREFFDERLLFSMTKENSPKTYPDYTEAHQTREK